MCKRFKVCILLGTVKETKQTVTIRQRMLFKGHCQEHTFKTSKAKRYILFKRFYHERKVLIKNIKSRADPFFKTLTFCLEKDPETHFKFL